MFDKGDFFKEENKGPRVVSESGVRLTEINGFLLMIGSIGQLYGACLGKRNLREVLTDVDLSVGGMGVGSG